VMSKKATQTARQILEKFNADSVGLSGLLTSPFGVLNELIRQNAETVMDPAFADDLVERLLVSGREICTPEEAIKLLSVADLAALVVHPFFIRAAARRGFSFYISADGSLHRQSHANVPQLIQPPIEGAIEPDFYVEQPWFGALERFVHNNQRVLLIGPAGSGKSQAVEHVFKKRLQSLQIVSCTPAMSVDDFEGKIDIRAGETVFTPSPCVFAVRDGHGLLLDEVGAAPTEACYSLYRCLDGKDMRIARQGYECVIQLNRNFRTVGTQNTEGRGDDRGIHHGRSHQDAALLDRWPNYIRVDYPAFETEVMILTKRTGISKKQAERVVKTAAELRRAATADRIMFVMTMRRTLAVAANMAAGFTPEEAWRFAVQNIATPEDSQTIEDFINRIYGPSAKKLTT
jgi:MoxR-like ATPase